MKISNDRYFFYILVSTYWIDVCERDSNLLAASGSAAAVNICDRREGKIIKTFQDSHLRGKGVK